MFRITIPILAALVSARLYPGADFHNFKTPKVCAGIRKLGGDDNAIQDWFRRLDADSKCVGEIVDETQIPAPCVFQENPHRIYFNWDTDTLDGMKLQHLVLPSNGYHCGRVSISIYLETLTGCDAPPATVLLPIATTVDVNKVTIDDWVHSEYVKGAKGFMIESDIGVMISTDLPLTFSRVIAGTPSVNATADDAAGIAISMGAAVTAASMIIF